MTALSSVVANRTEIDADFAGIAHSPLGNWGLHGVYKEKNWTNLYSYC